MERLCPRDRVRLVKSRFMNQAMDACTLCDGVWLDRGELAKIHGLKDDLLPGEAEADPRGEALCPDCGCAMGSRWFSGRRRVLIDVCPECGGVWLDSEELRAILKEVFLLKEQASVLVTTHGRCFHTRNCRLVATATTREMSYGQAAEAGKTPCKVCRPPEPEQLAALAKQSG